MVKFHKLSKKYNPSELINSSKTKKYIKLENKNYKKNIGNLINKQNKRKNIQKGGVNDPPKYGKIAQLFKFSIARAQRGKKGKFNVKDFNVYTKTQYFWLKRNIYNTIRGSWLLYQFNKVTKEEHELLKRLLKAHMYFARIKLVMVKIRNIINELYISNDSVIRETQRQIRNIFDLQMDIEYGYKNPNESQTEKSSYFSKITKRIGKYFSSKEPYGPKTYDVFINKIIDKQDEIRRKIMKRTIFYDTQDLGTKCNSFGITKTILRIGKQDFSNKYRKSKIIICTLGRYRKYESKFNKFYYLYREQYKKFIRAYPACDSSGVQQVFDAYLNIDEEEDKILDNYYGFEKSKCDSYDLKEKALGYFKEITDKLSKQVGKKGKNNIVKEDKITAAFQAKAADFTQLTLEFSDYIKAFKNMFQIGEAYGIRHHHGLPKKKGFLKGFLSALPWSSNSPTSEKKVFAKKERLEYLQKDPVFIKEFTDMITGFGNDVKTIFEPSSKEKTLKNSVIPNIVLYESYEYLQESTTSTTFNVKENFSVFSINLANIQDRAYNSQYFYKQFSDYERDGINALPVVVCVQNGFINKETNNTTIFEKYFLLGEYIPIAYSYAYNGIQSIDYKSYNIIYVRKNCINNEANRVDDIIAVDQTDYFTLKLLPEGEGITLEKFSKSFAAINFSFKDKNETLDTIEFKDYSEVGINDDDEDIDLLLERQTKQTKNATKKSIVKLKYQKIEEIEVPDNNAISNLVKNSGDEVAIKQIGSNLQTITKFLKSPDITTQQQHVAIQKRDELVSVLKYVKAEQVKTAKEAKEAIAAEKAQAKSQSKAQDLSKHQTLAPENQSQSTQPPLNKKPSPPVNQSSSKPSAPALASSIKAEIDKIKALFTDKTIITIDNSKIYNRVTDLLKDISNLFIKSNYIVNRIRICEDNGGKIIDGKTLKNKYPEIYKCQEIYKKITSNYSIIKYEELNEFINNAKNITDVMIDNLKKDCKKILEKKIKENKIPVQKPTINYDNEFNTFIENFNKIHNNDGKDEYLESIAIHFIDENKLLAFIEYNKNAKDKISDSSIAVLQEIVTENKNETTAGGALLDDTIQAYTIVTTELVGSRPEDLLHIEEIVKFKLREKQITEMFKIIKNYNGNEPHIICGDFGGTKEPIDDDKKLILLKYYVEKSNKISETDKIRGDDIKDRLEEFYTQGMNINQLNNYVYKYLYPNVEYTNFYTKLISNYIFFNSTIINNDNFGENFIPDDIISDPDKLKELKLPDDSIFINIYGEILPVTISFNMTPVPLSNIKPSQYVQIKGREYKDVKLYTEIEMKNIIRMIDKLMSQFTYGYKAYLKRDLGCFSFESEFKEDDTAVINKSPYNKRDRPLKTPFTEPMSTLKKKLETFYTMNYPGFIDVFLYQLSNFYNKGGGNKEIYYNENQISRIKNEENLHIIKEDHELNFLKGEGFKNKSELVKHTIIRMLLIPSDELKAITESEVDTTHAIHGKKEGIEYKITSAKDYMKLAEKFSHNFYRDKVIPRLEKRLNELINSSEFKVKEKVDKYTTDSQLQVQLDILNRGLLYELLKTDDEGIVETTRLDGTIEKLKTKQLKNLSNPKLIQNLFEFIFIMLKLKFVEKQIADIDKAKIEIEAPIVKSEKFAIISENYKNNANILYDFWLKYNNIKTKLNINDENDNDENDNVNSNYGIDENQEKIKNDIKKQILTTKIFDFEIDEDNSSQKILTDIDVDNEVFMPTEIKTMLELKNVEAYVAYSLIILICECIGIDSIEFDDSKQKQLYIKLKKLENELPTIVISDKNLGETVKQSIKLLIDKFLKVYNKCLINNIYNMNDDDLEAKIKTERDPIQRQILQKIFNARSMAGNPSFHKESKPSQTKTQATSLNQEPEHFSLIQTEVKSSSNISEKFDTIKTTFLSLKNDNGNGNSKYSDDKTLNDLLIENFKYGILNDNKNKENYENLLRRSLLDANDFYCGDTSSNTSRIAGCKIENLTTIQYIVEPSAPLEQPSAPPLNNSEGGGGGGKNFHKGGANNSASTKSIELVNDTINAVVERENKNKDGNDIYILNFASIENAGGQVLEGFMGEEEELCRTSYQFYSSLKEIYKNDKIKNIKKNLLNGENVCSSTQKVNFIRNDGCHQKPYEINNNDNNNAYILSIFTPKYVYVNNESTTEVKNHNQDITNSYDDDDNYETMENYEKLKKKIAEINKKESSIDENTKISNTFYALLYYRIMYLFSINSISKKKTLVIGTGIFNENFAPVNNKEEFEYFIKFVLYYIFIILANLKDEYNKIIFAVPNKSNSKSTLDIYDIFTIKCKTYNNDNGDNITIGEKKKKKVKNVTFVFNSKALQSFLEIIKKYINNFTIEIVKDTDKDIEDKVVKNKKKIKDVIKKIKDEIDTDFTFSKYELSRAIDYLLQLISSDDDNKYIKDIKENIRFQRFLVQYQNEIDSQKSDLEQLETYSNTFTVKYGDILEDLENNNVLIVDAAGSAFVSSSTTYNGSGISNYIYSNCEIDNNITNSRNKMFGETHNFVNKKTTNVFFNTEIQTRNPMCSPQNNEKKPILGIIHAIGPDSSKEFNDFNNNLSKTIENLFALLESSEIKKILDSRKVNTKKIELRLPLISSGVYGIENYKKNNKPNREYFKFYLEQIYDKFNAKPILDQIDLVVYIYDNDNKKGIPPTKQAYIDFLKLLTEKQPDSFITKATTFISTPPQPALLKKFIVLKENYKAKENKRYNTLADNFNILQTGGAGNQYVRQKGFSSGNQNFRQSSINNISNPFIIRNPPVEDLKEVIFYQGTITDAIVNMQTKSIVKPLIYVVNQSNIKYIGGNVEYGGNLYDNDSKIKNSDYVEEDLMLSSPQLYNTLKKFNNQDNNPEIKIFDGALWSDENWEKLMILNENVCFIRNSGDNYNKIKDPIIANVLTVGGPKYKEIKDKLKTYNIIDNQLGIKLSENIYDKDGEIQKLKALLKYILKYILSIKNANNDVEIIIIIDPNYFLRGISLDAEDINGFLDVLNDAEIKDILNEEKINLIFVDSNNKNKVTNFGEIKESIGGFNPIEDIKISKLYNKLNATTSEETHSGGSLNKNNLVKEKKIYKSPKHKSNNLSKKNIERKLTNTNMSRNKKKIHTKKHLLL